jgi:uncharacterized protein DUF2784
LPRAAIDAMRERILADAVVLLHFAFIAFVVTGAALVAWRRQIAALHLPALAWGLYTETTATVCPLTPLENALRQAAGQAGYHGGFVEEYLVRLIYPPGLTPSIQLAIAVGLVVVNALLYAWAFTGRRRLAPA